MATIITVHGTFASGPEEGSSWWQKSSIFEKDLRALVEGTDGNLNFQPLVWNGANSERSRREAANSLQKLVQQLEARGERYCILGHSHGGSIISSALMLSAYRRVKLPGLAKWITIGTPFIRLSRAHFLFARLGLQGKAAYAAMVTIALTFSLYCVQVAASGGALTAGVVIPFLLSIFIFLPLYLIVLARTRSSLFMHKKKAKGFAQSNYEPAWLALWHANDEAVQGLHSIVNMRVPVFDRFFAVPALSSISILVLPALLLTSIGSEQFINWLFLNTYHLVEHEPAVVRNGQLIGGGRSYLANLSLLVEISHNYLMDLFAPRNLRGNLDYELVPIYAFLMLFFGVPLIIFWVSLAITFTVTKLSMILSGLLSRVLNRLAWSQIRSSALGSDIPGERGFNVEKSPMWISSSCNPLPSAIGDDISERTNAAAAVSLAKFRAVLCNMVVADGVDQKTISFSEYLTWDELIHTSYFHSGQFRKLLAYAIATSPGFKPTEVFRNDLDYALVAGWLQQVKTVPTSV